MAYMLFVIVMAPGVGAVFLSTSIFVSFSKVLSCSVLRCRRIKHRDSFRSNIGTAAKLIFTNCMSEVPATSH